MNDLESRLKNTLYSVDELRDEGLEPLIVGDLYMFSTKKYEDNIYVFNNHKDKYQFKEIISYDRFKENKYYEYDTSKR